MSKYIDITGQRFNKFVVIKLADYKIQNRPAWVCKCDCGNYTTINGDSLRNGYTKSCGCARSLDLIGKKFGKLKVIQRLEPDHTGHYLWLCECECGGIKKAQGTRLVRGSTASCGCLNRGITSPGFKHGLYGTKEYSNAIRQKRRAKKKNQSPPLTENEQKKIQLYYHICDYLNEGDERASFHVDHIRPISKGGLHHPDNLQVLSAHLNLEKHDKYPLTPEQQKLYTGFRI